MESHYASAHKNYAKTGADDFQIIKNYNNFLYIFSDGNWPLC